MSLGLPDPRARALISAVVTRRRLETGADPLGSYDRPECQIRGCSKQSAPRRALCHMHLARQLRGVDMYAPEQVRGLGRLCDQSGCGRPHRARGKCDNCYGKWKRGTL